MVTSKLENMLLTVPLESEVKIQRKWKIIFAIWYCKSVLHLKIETKLKFKIVEILAHKYSKTGDFKSLRR